MMTMDCGDIQIKFDNEHINEKSIRNRQRMLAFIFLMMILSGMLAGAKIMDIIANSYWIQEPWQVWAEFSGLLIYAAALLIAAFMFAAQIVPNINEPKCLGFMSYMLKEKPRYELTQKDIEGSKYLCVTKDGKTTGINNFLDGMGVPYEIKQFPELNNPDKVEIDLTSGSNAIVTYIAENLQDCNQQ